jgi:hypothetical protein
LFPVSFDSGQGLRYAFPKPRRPTEEGGARNAFLQAEIVDTQAAGLSAFQPLLPIQVLIELVL